MAQGSVSVVKKVAVQDDRHRLNRISHLLSQDVSRLNEQQQAKLVQSRLEAIRWLVTKGKLPTYVHILPSLLNLKGKPYTLVDHFAFEPLFQTKLARNIGVKAARQVSKSTFLAARGIIQSNAMPNEFTTLYITPLYEQIRRFSTNYVRPFVDTSPVKSAWISTKTENSVLQRSFTNRSKMIFSFAQLDADRTRGISADANNFDECQDLDWNHVPIIRETMSASPWRLMTFTGTPKGLDNAVEFVWQRSSQAEWLIKCRACNYINVPSLDHDIEKMIGPYRDDISEARPGTICAKCRRPISPREGRWVHKYPELRWRFPGYHIPQIIMPMHYHDPERWSELLGKQAGSANTTTAKFYNEVLGESFDVGTKLVTKTDIQNASVLPFENDPIRPIAALATKDRYLIRVLGVDWGGGGEDEVSFTTMAVLGLRPDGKIDVIYGRRLLMPHQHLDEAREILKIFNLFECHLVAHDFNGAGSLRETIMIQAGIDETQVIPMVYCRSAAKNIMVFKGGNIELPRNYWLLDKARALVLVCQCIKMQQIRFFKYDFKDSDNPGLLHDFLALTENKVETSRGPEIYTIVRNPMFTDDFAQSVNMGACAIWHRMDAWPNIAQISALRLTLEQESAWNPANPWTEANEFYNQV